MVTVTSLTFTFIQYPIAEITTATTIQAIYTPPSPVPKKAYSTSTSGRLFPSSLVTNITLKNIPSRTRLALTTIPMETLLLILTHTEISSQAMHSLIYIMTTTEMLGIPTTMAHSTLICHTTKPRITAGA